jgi:heterogeneous nuclear ribonucleoprotein L
MHSPSSLSSAAKRQRVSYNSNGSSTAAQPKDPSNNSDDAETKLPPSLVIHVRNLSESTNEADIKSAFEKYGSISFIHMISRKRQALIEFNSMSSAISCVQETSRKEMTVGGAAVYVNYSKSQRIERAG